jgi:hypothetical protein
VLPLPDHEAIDAALPAGVGRLALPFSVKQFELAAPVKSGEKLGLAVGHAGVAQAEVLTANTAIAAIAACIINLVIAVLMTLSLSSQPR